MKVLTETDIELAIHMVQLWHKGQMYNDQPYFDHVWHVYKSAESYPLEIRLVAILHDILEDTKIEPQQILVWFGDVIFDALDAITHRKDQETYVGYIKRCKLNPLARQVKILDLKENLRVLKTLPLEHPKQPLGMRYVRALEILENDPT